MKKKLELQLSLWGSCNFKIYPILFVFSFLFGTLYKQGGVVIQFHIKKIVHMGWIKRFNQKQKKQIMHIFKILNFPTYLST
jgi:hypothetical protein